MGTKTQFWKVRTPPLFCQSERQEWRYSGLDSLRDWRVKAVVESKRVVVWMYWESLVSMRLIKSE